MQIGNVSQAPSPEQTRQQTPTSVDSQIEKLERLKQKLEADTRKTSANPDPLAAQGENAANKGFNSKEIEKLEAQIATLRNQQANEAQAKAARKEESAESVERAESPAKTPQVGSTSGGFVDRFV